MKKLFTLLFATILFISCSSDDDNNDVTYPKDAITGSFEVTSMTIDGERQDYTCLDANNLEVTVEQLTLNASFSINLPCKYTTFKAFQYSVSGNKVVLDRVDQVSAELFTNYDITIVNENKIDVRLTVSGDMEVRYIFER